MGTSLALLVLAVLVRGLEPEPPLSPADQPADRPRVEEPAQFLARGAKLRIRELDAWVSEELKVQWRAQRNLLFALRDCPPLKTWVEGEEGQRLERFLSELRSGTREDALAALAMIFQLARASEWETGMLGGSQHAQRLGGLLKDWLRSWAERGCEDPVLYEPTLSAALLYGRAMRAAYLAPVVGRNEAAYERARNFLWELCGTGTRRRTAFGEAFQSAHPRASTLLAKKGDFLQGFSQEARALFPDLDGGCGD